MYMNMNIYIYIYIYIYMYMTRHLRPFLRARVREHSRVGERPPVWASDTFHIRNSFLLGPYSTPLPRAL